MCIGPPQRSIFCGAEFGSKTALDLQQKLKPFLHSSLKQWQCDFFLEFLALSCISEVLFVKFPRFLAFFVGYFLDRYIFMQDCVAALRNIP